MKKNTLGMCFVFFALAGIFSLSFRQSAPAANLPVTSWKFDSTEKYIGNISIWGGVQTTIFTFTNTGANPLKIGNAWSNCSCMKIEWGKEEVPPGKQGFIKVTYMPAQKGKFLEPVSVQANVKNGGESLYMHYSVVR